MRWNPPNNRSNGGYSNRECRNCTPPCQGGEVLHKAKRNFVAALNSMMREGQYA